MLEKRKEYIQFKIFRKYEREIEYLSLSLILLLVPLFIGKPQYLVGTIVNAVLVYSTLKFGFKNTIPFLILPSCMSYLRGILFNNLTIFLVYLIPFIIISNAIYSFIISRSQGKALGILIACILKTGFLYLIVKILINTISLPDIFLTTMGISQLITGITGGFLGYFTYKNLKA